MPSDRRLYVRPGRLTTRVLNPVMARLGAIETLAVRGRRSGAWRVIPVRPLEHGGARYLVSPRGETDWVRNLRAAGAGELRLRSRAQAFDAAEVPEAAKAPIIRAYLRRYGWFPAVRAPFKALPEPSQHPVFLITSMSGSPQHDPGKDIERA